MTDPVSPELSRDSQAMAAGPAPAIMDESPVAQRPADDDTEASAVSAGVPRPAGFWNSGDGAHALDDPTPFGQENALQKLGRPPFEKSARSKFRLLGYLATVYEHVSQDLR